MTVRLWLVAMIDRIRYRDHDVDVFPYAFDLLELDTRIFWPSTHPN
jgi:hypothetical protein